MADGIYPQQKRNLRSHFQKNKEGKKALSVTTAQYAGNFSIVLSFSSGKKRLINFLPLFEKHVKGENLKYFAPERFKKFIVKNGNIYWGRNEDVIFPVSLLQGSKQESDKEEIVYIR